MKSKIHEHKKNNLKKVSKKILFGIFALLLYCNISWGQSLMSDEDHRIMMDTYATNLNSVLVANCPQGTTIDNFKKKIVNGELTLSSGAQASIITYAIPLKTYGGNFATAKGLAATTDAYKYFFSSFAPSAMVQNGKLVESTTTPGLAATEMWSCALENFNTDGCGLSALVSDNSNLNTLTSTCVSKLTVTAGNMGILVMLNGFSECIRLSDNTKLISNFKEKLKTDINFINFTKSYFNSCAVASTDEINIRLLSGNYHSNSNNIPSSETKNSIYDMTTHLVLFYNQNSDFDFLSNIEKTELVSEVMGEALSNVNNAIADGSTSKFANNSLEFSFLGYRNRIDIINRTLPQTSRGITWGEAGACAVGALGTYIGDNWSLIKTLYGAVRGEAMTFGVIRSAVLLFFPEAKMAATVASLTFCLVSAYFWGE